MPRDGQPTKTKLLNAAEALVLERGFAGTSVDDIIERSQVSRGTFFYHFPTKNDLARRLIERYADTDRALSRELMERAESEHDDPLDQLLAFVRGYERLFEEREIPHSGCLYASYSYEAGLFDEETTRVVLSSVEGWTALLSGKIEEVVERGGVDSEIDPAELAWFGHSVFEGAFIVSRVLEDPTVLARQLAQYRRYLEVILRPTVASSI